MKLKHNFCFQSLFIFASVVFNVAYAVSLPKNQIQLAGQAVRSDRVIVRFKGASQAASIMSQQTSFFSELGLKEKKTIKFSPMISSATTTATNQSLEISILAFNGKKDLKTVLKRLNEHPAIQYAEPDLVLHKKSQPNDGRFSELWGLDNQGQVGGVLDADIDAPEAWNTITDSTSIVVGVVDTGVDYTHEDLVANMWVNPGEIPLDGIDNDGNGYVDDIHGINCADGDSDPMDLANHGTHVAGTIGAEGNNGIGITGVSWNAKIMALKVFGESDFVSATIECLAYAVNMKQNYGVDIRITNNSYGNENSQAQKDAIQASANVGMLFITAAGNFSDDNDIVRDYPGDYDIDNIISVAATDRNDQLAFFSNFGATSVDMGAPGEGVLSTTIGDDYQVFDGTSMASPHVAGAAALLWANNLSLSPLEIKNKLMNQGDTLDSLIGKTVSGRRLNINTAINCVPGSPLLKIISPKDQFNLLLGEVVVKAELNDCGEPVTGIDVLALPENGDASFNLLDDGLGEDMAENDGIYTGIWQIQKTEEAISLSVNAESLGVSDSVSGKVIKNYRLDAEYPFEWIDASSGTRLEISNVDDGSEIIALGFDFEFYEASYSEIVVDANGFLKFGNNDELSVYTNFPIPDNAIPNGFIAPYWDDLNPGALETANIYTLLEGAAPNRRLTIAWIEIPFYDEFNDDLVTFEVTLYEGSNDIVYQYGNVNSADSATIGVEHSSGDFGLQYLFNGQNNGTSVQVNNEQAIRFFIDEDTSTPTTGVTLPPTDDANNRATLGDKLAVSKWEHAFFKYEVDTPQNDIKKAIFRVYYEGHNPPLTLFVGAADDDWSEGSATPPLTYIHNNPELQLSSANVTSQGYVEFDVTDYVLDPTNVDGIVTLEISSNQSGWNILSSKEGDNSPELVIETNTRPAIGTLGASDDANNLADLDGLLAVSKWEHAFFKFDASDIEQEVSKATLRVYYEARRAPLTLFVGAVDDDNWTESSGTPLRTFIHDRPELQLASAEGIAAGYVEFDVTDYVADQLSSDGDGIVTLEVSSNHGSWDILSSKEGEFPPELVVETESISNQSPIAVFNTIPDNGEAPLIISLDASESSDPDGQVVSYSWDFGDGTNTTGVNVSHTYLDAGTYTVTLTVTDNLGATAVTTKNIVVFQVPIILEPTDDANNQASLIGALAVSKWEHAFFRFDTSTLQNQVSKAIFRVYYEARRAPLTLYVGGVEDDNWTESSGTPLRTFIHDRPDLQLASADGAALGYVEFDVTDFVENQVSSDGIVTLEVSSSHNNWDILSSKEGVQPPELIIEAGVVPVN